MSADTPSETEAASAPWPLWKKGAMTIAALLLVVGGAAQGYARLTPAPAPTQRTAQRTTPRLAQSGEVEGPDGVATLVAAGATRTSPGREPGLQIEEPKEGARSKSIEAAVTISPIFVESGLSFFLAFCIAVALRAVAKIAAIGVGVMLLLLLALQYAGMVEPVDWSKFQGAFETGLAWLQVGAQKIQSWTAHALPSGTMGGLGIAAGFKK